MKVMIDRIGREGANFRSVPGHIDLAPQAYGRLQLLKGLLQPINHSKPRRAKPGL